MMAKFTEDSTVQAFVDVLKAIKNNKILNPTKELTGNKYEDNENLYGMLTFVFDMIPNLDVNRTTLENVETKHTWDEEFDALGGIISFIAKHDLINASSALSEGLTKSGLEKLKNPRDEEHPNNYDLPGLLKEIDRSYIFAQSMGPFLDNSLGSSMSGFLFDEGDNISFSNVTNWTNESETIKGLLDAMYNLTSSSGGDDILSNFDLKNFDDIDELNDMLHQLAHSGIFTYIDSEDHAHYLYGKWLYGKVESSMEKFTVTSGSTENDYDLLADPQLSVDKTWGWNDNWGIRPEDSSSPDSYFLEWKNKYDADGSAENKHYIAYKDFAFINGMADDNQNLPKFWCDYSLFEAKREAFLGLHKGDMTTTYITDNEWGKSYASDAFMTDYESVFEVDEISRVSKFMAYAMRIMNPKDASHGGAQMDLDKIPASLLRGLLYSLNDTHCLRISVYNFYRIAAESVLNGYSNFSLDAAYNIYMVDTDEEMFNFGVAHNKRQDELQKLVSFYELIDTAKTKGIIVGSTFKYEAMNDDDFMADMKIALEGLNESFVFHRKGSALVAKEETTFQGLFNTLLGESEIKNIIYLGANSPKDEANSGLYTNSSEKVKYLVDSVFLTDEGINAFISANPGSNFDTKREEQIADVDCLVDSINRIYSLKDKEGHSVTSIDAADMNSSENRNTIKLLLESLNESNLLFDLVPNTIYNLFIKNNKFTISSGSDSVDFSRADPFYHYYYNESLVKREAPDFNARYLDDDIDGLYNLLGDYQQYNSLLNGKKVTNKVVLKSLIDENAEDGFQANGCLPTLLGHLHDCNIFHSPARDGAYAIYYTDKFEDNGLTLFEEVMCKICKFTGLDGYAYDDAYAPDHNNYGSAATKLAVKAKALSLADDTGSSATYYHTEKDVAWNQEIDAFMKLAYNACDFGEGEEISVSSFEINKLKITQLKDILTDINDCDLISDAVPGFVKKGFDTINLGSLTTYDGVVYANYHIGQEAYGGENGDAPEGSEIKNIIDVMKALNTGTDENPNYSTQITDMTAFVQGEGSGGGLKGLLKFIYDSRIFNTSLNGVYNEFNVIEKYDRSFNISAQGLLFYKSLDTDSSRYVLSYIARDADSSTPEAKDLDKIAVLSKIFHMKGNYFDVNEKDNTYEVESEGLKKLIDLTQGNLSADTFTTDTNISNVDSKRALIKAVIRCAYNATGDNETPEVDWQRSCIVSEVVSGLFNNILENQYTKIASKPGYQYVTFSFGDANANTLTFSSYASLNKNEENGLDGILDCVNILTSAGGDPLVYAFTLKTQRTALRTAFSKMGYTATTNSEIARAVYLAEAHSYFRTLADNEHIVDGSGHQFNAVNETSCDSNGLNNIYSYNDSDKFSFAAYGERIELFLNTVTLSY